MSARLTPLVVVLFVVLGAVVPFVGSEYALSFSIQLLIFTVLAYSWNLIGGYAGYTHFGQMALFGIGAYVGAIAIADGGWPWYAAAAGAGIVGALIALPLGVVMLRLRGPFFAIGMYGIARVLESFALGFDSVTRGGTGIYLSPISNLRAIYWVLLAIAVAGLLATWWLDNSRLGLRLLALREDEDAAAALGLSTTRLKVGAFVVSAIAPATVGSLYVSYLAFVDPPTAFAPNMELTTIASVLIGGLGTVLGPLIGSVGLALVNEWLWARYPQVYMLCIGSVILFCVLFAPRGLTAAGARVGWLPDGRGAFRRIAASIQERSR